MWQERRILQSNDAYNTCCQMKKHVLTSLCTNTFAIPQSHSNASPPHFATRHLLYRYMPLGIRIPKSIAAASRTCSYSSVPVARAMYKMHL